MNKEDFERVFTQWKRQAETYNQLLHPIAHREVDINDPDWHERLANQPHPVDEASLRNEVTSLFNEFIANFVLLVQKQRQQVIDLIYKNDSLQWSAIIDADENTHEGFRKHMILFVIKDQGRDTRDAIVELRAYRKEAELHSIDVDTIFSEMVDIASDIDKFGWGSTRDLFLRY